MLSIQTMTTDFNLYNTSDTSLSSNYDKQTSVEDETDANETVKSSESNFRHRSQKFMKKFRRFSLNSILTYSKTSTNEQNGSRMSLNASHNNRYLDSDQLNITTSLNSDLKGILKNPKHNRSNSYPTIFSRKTSKSYQHSVSLPITTDSVNNKENNTDHMSSDKASISPYILSDSSLTIKRVKFNDKISTRNYEPDDPVSSIQKLSLDEQNDSLNERSINTNTDEENSIKSLTSCRSTEDRFQDVIDSKCL